MESLLQQPFLSLNYTEVDDTMSRDSQSELFPGLNRGFIRRAIHRVTHNIDMVDEIEQEVSFIWYSNRWRRGFIGNHQKYVERIAIREAARHVRLENEKRERFKAYVGSEQPLDVPLLRQEAPDPAEIVFVRSTVNAFKSSLPAYLAPVLDLRLQGYGAQEIATSLGIKFSTSKSYLAEIAAHADDFFNKSATATSLQYPRKED